MKSKVALLRYEYTSNKGNYESEKVGVELIPAEGMTAEECLAEAKEFIHGEKPKAVKAVKPKKEEAAVEKEEEEEKPKGKKRSKGASPYDRTDETHKKLFTETLDKELPGWRTKSPKKAKEASSILAGEEFLDNDGDVIPEFTQKLIKLME